MSYWDEQSESNKEFMRLMSLSIAWYVLVAVMVVSVMLSFFKGSYVAMVGSIMLLLWSFFNGKACSLDAEILANQMLRKRDK